MTDPLTPEQRRKVMQSNKGKGTRLELAVRRGLHARGLRYRLHGPRSIGSPDLVFKARKAVVFVHGCFWHQHAGCQRAAKVSQGKNGKWASKFEDNLARDKRNIERAHAAGFRVAVVWECVIEQKKNSSVRREPALDSLTDWLVAEPNTPYLEIG
ncbi:very short patch repair endonuclease [uncultured Litoreibacter sp.]|uniref:very short patch repair endonuclease n=1 Tax=uncultured Litoreibacter sp. TaxID=1392394 RepID=UPI003457B16A